MQVNRSDEERLKQCTLGTNQLEVEPKCLILVRREFQVVPAAGMKKALMLGRTARELALFRDVEEDRSGEVETRTTRVHAERLELITDGMDGGEQRTEAWIAGRWQPVVLHPDRGWVDRSIGALDQSKARTGRLQHRADGGSRAGCCRACRNTQRRWRPAPLTSRCRSVRDEGRC